MRPLSRNDRATIVWDSGDVPTGRFSGLYCSLDNRLFDTKRHATSSYPICYNEIVNLYPQGDAIYDFSFHGGLTSRIRGKIVHLLQNDWRHMNILSKVQTGPWQAMFDRSGLEVKKSYADNLRKSKFVLCPRGVGYGSVRLFETLKSGRVPIIISDRYVLPANINWADCAMIVKEADIATIPAVVAKHMPSWSELSRNARKIWNDNFSHSGLLSYMGSLVPSIMDNARLPRGDNAKDWQYPYRVANVLINRRLKINAGRLAKKVGLRI
jgi:hypothetical protein